MLYMALLRPVWEANHDVNLITKPLQEYINDLLILACCEASELPTLDCQQGVSL